MQDKRESSASVPPEPPFGDVSMRTSGAPLYVEHKIRPSWYVIATLLVVSAAAIAVLVYSADDAPPTSDAGEWSPPAGLGREDTPEWLRTLCADRTPELCAAADRARTATECPGIRAAIKALNGVQNRIAEEGRLSAGQRYVLIDLYGQAEELCPKNAVE